MSRSMLILTLAAAAAITAPLTQAATFINFQFQGWNGADGSGTRSSNWAGGSSSGAPLQLFLGSASTNLWSTNMRPTVDCPSVCSSFTFASAILSPFSGVFDVWYQGETYHLNPSPGNGAIVAYSLEYKSVTPSIATVTSTDNLEGGYNSVEAVYPVVPVTLVGWIEIASPAGNHGILTIFAEGQASGSAFVIRSLSTGNVLHWEESRLYRVSSTEIPEPGPWAMLALGGALVAVWRTLGPARTISAK